MIRRGMTTKQRSTTNFFAAKYDHHAGKVCNQSETMTRGVTDINTAAEYDRDGRSTTIFLRRNTTTTLRSATIMRQGMQRCNQSVTMARGIMNINSAAEYDRDAAKYDHNVVVKATKCDHGLGEM
ncbi:hypothetical protein BaRGS_00011505 [Batillaria attramentaria]|uniref:Uncharacterized protein n=1 Tax=Batillaria attramentaria TaxID=370345 RepID=A0ABD0LCX7_9CAEN